MQSSEIFKKDYKDFTISAELSTNSKVLKLKAVSAQDEYSFAIDNDYLREHPHRFANIFESPHQLFQQIKINSSTVVFKGGKLQFNYSEISPGPRTITILLFRNKGTKKILNQHEVKVAQLINSSMNKVSQLKVAENKLIVDFNSLVAKIQDLENQLKNIKQGKIFIPDPSRLYIIRLAQTFVKKIDQKSSTVKVQSLDMNSSNNNIANLWQYWVGDNQKWKLQSDAKGNFTIINFKTGLVLQVPENSKEKVDSLYFRKRQDKDNEKWRIDSAKNGLLIKSALSGQVLTCFEHFDNGDKVGLDSFKDNASDNWLIIRADF